MYIVLLLSICYASVCFGQQHIKQHIKFNDLELNGSLSSFVLQLEKKGYSLKSKEDIGAMFEGTFIRTNSIVCVYAAPKTKTVYQVIVSVASSENFSSAKAEYQSFKELLTEKYGKPAASVEHFQNHIYDGDALKTWALQDGKGTFYTIYQIETGSILLCIVYLNNSLQILITYTDGLNSEINSKEQEEIL